MRRFLIGAFTLLASVALPATFGGPVFLATLWVLLGLVGVTLLVTSEPVKRPLLETLRRELELPPAGAQSPALLGVGDQAEPRNEVAQLRRAIGHLLQDFEDARARMEWAVTMDFWWKHQLDIGSWDEHGAVLSTHGLYDTHKTVRAAIIKMQALDELHHDAWVELDNKFEGDPPPHARPAVGEIDRGDLKETLEAVKLAERALEEAQP